MCFCSTSEDVSQSFPQWETMLDGQLDGFIALLAWLLGGSIGGLLADRIILENDYPRKRSTLALGGFFTAFAICITNSIFMGIVNTISIL